MFFKRALPVFQRGRKLLSQTPLVSYPLVKSRSIYCCNCLRKTIASTEGDFLNDLVIDHSSKDPGPSVDFFYSDEERTAILELLNTASEHELAAVKLLRGKKSASIVDYRTQHGPFHDLHSLTKVPNFKYKSTVKVCESIIGHAERGERKERRVPEFRPVNKLIKPEIRRDKLEAAESIVSIVFGTHKIAWAHVDRNRSVLDWQQQECFRFMKGTYLASVYLEDISSVVAMIPRADYYILEKPSLSIQNVNLFPVALHLRTVEAMLYALLDKEYLEGGDHSVLNMARNAVGKHFELIIGDSRTSGIDLVKQFLLESVTNTEPRVFFPRDMVVRYRNKFQTSGANREEEMCDALLQAIAFYELVFFNGHSF
ncbi:transcription elongation factor, mitochondrial [Ambystoma mexicanum]|uniref:transcription elongation factor, mitochondrial n=1 Tax=Ambystoma mexicanum TaxID=8296 RepID=UPI0037E82C53